MAIDAALGQADTPGLGMAWRRYGDAHPINAERYGSNLPLPLFVPPPGRTFGLVRSPWLLFLRVRVVNRSSKASHPLRRLGLRSPRWRRHALTPAIPQASPSSSI